MIFQTPSEGTAKISPERRDVLINCAHFMAAFLNWDLTILEKGLVQMYTQNANSIFNVDIVGDIIIYKDL